MLSFYKAMVQACTPEPAWFTKYTVHYEDDAIRVLCFRHGITTPILILPPQAGHHSCIADYGRDQSLVQMLQRETDRPVYAIE